MVLKLYKFMCGIFPQGIENVRLVICAKLQKFLFNISSFSVVLIFNRIFAICGGCAGRSGPLT